jgi:hypothetical protein
MKKILIYLFLLISLTTSGQAIHGVVASSSGGGAPSSSLLTGLLCYYKFDEASGNLVDASGQGRTGTPTGITYAQAGKIGTAISFNGTTSNISVSSFPQPVNALTISFWIKTTDATDDKPLLYLSDGTHGIKVLYYTGQFSLNLLDGTYDNEFITTGTYNDNTFHNVIFVWDGTNVTGYVDNVVKISGTWVHTLDYGSTSVMVFMSTFYGVKYLGGILDEFGIWNRGITSGERITLSTGTLTHPW